MYRAPEVYARPQWRAFTGHTGTEHQRAPQSTTQEKAPQSTTTRIAEQKKALQSPTWHHPNLAKHMTEHHRAAQSRTDQTGHHTGQQTTGYLG